MLNKNLKKLNIKLIIVPILILVVIFLLKYIQNPSQGINLISLEQKPGSCSIVAEEFCKKFKLIDSPTTGTRNSIAAFNLPAGTKLFAPTNGYASNKSVFKFNSRKETYGGFTIAFSTSSNLKNLDQAYVFVFNGTHTNPKTQVKKGEIIGTVTDSKIKDVGDYNLMFYIFDISIFSENPDKLAEFLK